jgi:hypothetical protein
MKAKRRYEMLDWTETATWFTTGFGTMVVLAIILALFLFFARRAQHR